MGFESLIYASECFNDRAPVKFLSRLLQMKMIVTDEPCGMSLLPFN